METALLWIAVVLLVLAGLAGLVLPALPGPPLLFGGLWLAAWIEGFTYVGVGTVVVLGIMAALMYAVDIAATAFGARRFGASNRALFGAAIGTVVGLLLGFVGVIIGPFVGAVIGEISARRGLVAAGRAGFGATVGLVLGAAAKLALGFAMLGVFIVDRIV